MPRRKTLLDSIQVCEDNAKGVSNHGHVSSIQVSYGPRSPDDALDVAALIIYDDCRWDPVKEHFLKISPHPFDLLSPPGREIERVREVLRLAGDFPIAELHDAHRVDRTPVVGDHVLAHPQIAAADHSAHGKAQFRRVVSA